MSAEQLKDKIHELLPFVNTQLAGRENQHEWSFVKKSLVAMSDCCTKNIFDLPNKQQLNISHALIAIYPEIRTFDGCDPEIEKLFEINSEFQNMGIPTYAEALNLGCAS